MVPANHFGAIAGRSTAQCIVSSEADALSVAAKGNEGMWLIANMRAAFTSISRRFVIALMYRLGFPDNLTEAIITL